MVDFTKLKAEQIKLAKKVILKDSFKKIELVAGADCSYEGNKAVCAIVACDYKTLEAKEMVFAAAEAKIPYVAGFLAYREAASISLAFSKLRLKPDVMILDGNGVLHERRCGLASHIGVLLDLATIGCAKSLNLGEVKDSKVYVDNEVRAEVMSTREHSKPINISPGHKISLKTSVEIAKNCLKFPHKLPEPLHLAHRYANEIVDKILKGELKK